MVAERAADLILGNEPLASENRDVLGDLKWKQRQRSRDMGVMGVETPVNTPE